MKKVFFLLMLSIGFVINGFSITVKEQTGNEDRNIMQEIESEHKGKAESVNLLSDPLLFEQDIPKPDWDCWALIFRIV